MSGVLLAASAAAAAPPPAFVSAGAGATEAPVSGTLQVPYPSGIETGGLLVCQVYVEDSVGTTISVPAGWTNISNVTTIGALNQMRTFQIASTGSESGNLDVTCTADSFAVGRMYFFSNCDSVEGAGGTNTDASSTTVPARDVTTTGDNRLAVQTLAARVNTTIGNISGESGADYTEAIAEYSSTAPATLSCQTADVPTATAITGGNATLGSAGTFRMRSGFALYKA